MINKNELISLKNINLTLDKKLIFENFSLNFFNDGITVILGPNGSGKTLLTKVILGLTKIDKGAVDLKENKSLLLENNFENLNSISWDKGCYVGQELTARMKYRALLKKRIYSLIVKDGIPQIEQTIIDDKNNYGKIINVENNSILAMLNIELAESKINEQKKIKTNDGLVLEFIV